MLSRPDNSNAADKSQIVNRFCKTSLSNPFEFFAPFSEMLYTHYAVTIQPYQLGSAFQ